MTALKSLLFLIVAAGLGAGYIPFVLLPSGPQVPTGRFAYLAFPLWLLGGGSILWCFWDFTFTGHGTPAPIDPPKALVATGFYRYVRNPIYVSVLTILIGHFLCSEQFGCSYTRLRSSWCFICLSPCMKNRR